MKSLRILLCFVLICAVIIGISGCTQEEIPDDTPKKKHIDWSVYGTWVTNDGVAEKSFSYTLSATFPAKFVNGKITVIDFDIVWPESFPYRISQPQAFAVAAFSSFADDQQTFIKCDSTVYKAANNHSYTLCLIICPEIESVLMTFGDNSDCYFVGSTDPEADPNEILKHFKSGFPIN